MYKYLMQYHAPIYGRIQQYINKYSEIGDYLNDLLKSSKRNYRRELTEYSIPEIIKKEGEELAYKKIYFLEESEIDISLLEKYLNNILTRKLVPLKGNSELKRLIRIFDFIKFRSVYNKSLNSANT